MSGHDLTRRRLLESAAAGSLVVCSGGWLAACGGDEESNDTLALARKAGFLRLGVANEPPYGYFEGEKLTGLGPELARRIARELDIPEVAGVVTEFGRLIRGLKAGAFDVIAAGMFVNPERCAEVAFGHPFYCTRTALAVLKGNPRRLHNLDDIAQRRARLGVLDGAAEADDARAARIPESHIVPIPDLQSMGEAVEDGTVDAVALTSVSIRTLAAGSSGRLEATEPFDTSAAPPCGAFAFRQENRDLRERFDEGLRKLQQSGAAVSIGKRFDFTADEIISPVRRSTDALCRG